MEQRLSIATLAAADLPRLTWFYERLGWTVGFQNESVAFFQLNGVVLGLWRRDEFARELGVAQESLRPGGTALGHNVRTRAEVDLVLEAACSAGARIVQPAKDAVWGGRSGHFADPEGFMWEVAWNPAWPIDADGDVHLAGHDAVLPEDSSGGGATRGRRARPS